jgi:fructose-1,6-bisphosphatase/inositol monophosphatase family enzyme
VHYTAFTSTHAWDHLAGLLMHDEAGGHHARFDGAPYRMSDAKGGLLVAPDQASLRELYERLFMI